MSIDERIIGEEGLQYFGKMLASTTHELKNTLAIINESAGLLEDFTAMAARGMPLDPERLDAVASKVKHQVSRSDDIILRINRLAHTTDKPTNRVNLIELLEQVCDLAERLATMGGVVLEVATASNPITIETSPFRLQNIIWHSIDFFIRQPDFKGVVRLQAKIVGEGINIRIAPEPHLPDDTNLDDILLPDRRQALLDSIGANLSLNDDRQHLVLTLPLVPTS